MTPEGAGWHRAERRDNLVSALSDEYHYGAPGGVALAVAYCNPGDRLGWWRARVPSSPACDCRDLCFVDGLAVAQAACERELARLWAGAAA